MLVTWLAPFINIWQSGETLEKRVSLFCVVNQGDGSGDGSWYKVIGALCAVRCFYSHTVSTFFTTR